MLDPLMVRGEGLLAVDLAVDHVLVDAASVVHLEDVGKHLILLLHQVLQLLSHQGVLRLPDGLLLLEEDRTLALLTLELRLLQKSIHLGEEVIYRPDHYLLGFLSGLLMVSLQLLRVSSGQEDVLLELELATVVGRTFEVDSCLG
jgi:hypothetical protein